MRILLSLIVAVGLTGPLRAAGSDAAFRDGLSAFNSAEYARAMATWQPLADAGDPRAQEGIGFMYYSGRGVARDSQRAATYFYRAANQGEPTSQLFLAIMHFKADGVPQNLPLAMMWSQLAMSDGLAEAYDWNATIMQSMTDAERATAWHLITRWREIYEKSRPDK